MSEKTESDRRMVVFFDAKAGIAPVCYQLVSSVQRGTKCSRPIAKLSVIERRKIVDDKKHAVALRIGDDIDFSAFEASRRGEEIWSRRDGYGDQDRPNDAI